MKLGMAEFVGVAATADLVMPAALRPPGVCAIRAGGHGLGGQFLYFVYTAGTASGFEQICSYNPCLVHDASLGVGSGIRPQAMNRCLALDKPLSADNP